MSVSSILDSTAFSGLDNAAQKAVRQLFAITYQSGKPLKLDHLQLFRQRKSLAVSLAFYGDLLDETNPASFKFLSRAQRKVRQEELLFAFYIFSAQYQLDESEHRRQDLPARSAQIKKCADLIYKLRNAPRLGAKESPEQIQARAIYDSEKHAKYLGLRIIAPLVAEKMVELTTDPDAEQWAGANKSGYIRDWMNEVNGRRLYWVWANAMLGSVFALLPEDFANNPQAQKAVGAVSPVTGYMSWILYYARFGINLSLLLKHTIAGPWMSTEEQQIPAWERFKTQWDQRKFALLNDSIWATANMACFLWLTGSGMLGYLGNVATTALLLMDVSLTVWRFYEEDTQHNADMARYERDIAELRYKFTQADKDADRKVIELQLAGLLKAKKRCEFDWQYKKYGTINDLVYAASLLIAFSMMCCFLFPPAAVVPGTALILGLAGGAMCFMLNFVWSTMTNYLEVDKARAKSREAIDECKALLETFMKTDDDFEKKQLYLDMKRLMGDSDYQEKLVFFQKLKLVHAVLIEALVPPLVFVSLMFMPLGIGLAVLAAGFALAVIAHYILKEYAPEEAKLPEFDADEYACFALLDDPKIGDIKMDKKPDAQEKLKFFDQGKSASDEPPGYDSLVPVK